MDMRRLHTNMWDATVTAVLMLVISGCGAVQHTVNLDAYYLPQSRTTIEVGEVTNETGEAFDINIEQMLSEALAQKLQEKELLWSGGDGHKLTLMSKIVEYEKGNAFKRWLLPGWGSTVLNIQCELREGRQLMGTAEARRTVSIGGGYTIGAWKSIFASIANDVVDDLQSKIRR